MAQGKADSVSRKQGNLYYLYVVGKEMGDTRSEEIVHALLPRCGIQLTAVVPKPRQVFEIVLSDETAAFTLERDGFSFKGKHINVYPSVPKGTWVRIRGIPLFWTNEMITRVFSEYGQITSGPIEVLYRDTHVSTGDRSLKIDLVRSIPQDVAAHVDSETFALTVRYREQPKACFACGETGHLKQDCPKTIARSYSSVVAATHTNGHTHTQTTELRQQNTTQQHNAKYTQPQSTPAATTHAGTPAATTHTSAPVTTASINIPVTTPHTSIPVTTAPTKPCTPPTAKQNNTYAAPSTKQSQKSRRSPKPNNNKRKGDPSVERAATQTDKQQNKQKYRSIGGRNHLLSDGECTD